jgi:hypothetical protein
MMADTDKTIHDMQDREDSIKHMYALHEIIMESGEAEIVRIAVQALTGTASGRAYLELHPITL